MFTAIGHGAVRLRWAILGITLALVVPAAIFGGSVHESLTSGGYDVPGAESFRAGDLIEERLGLARADLIALYSVEGESIVSSPAAAEIDAALGAVAQDEGVRQTLHFFNTGAAQFVSTDGRRTFAVFTLVGSEDERVETFERLGPQLEVNGATLLIGGEIAAFSAFNETLEADLQRSELITFPLMAILLLLIFRTAVAAGLALILGGLAIVFALALLRAIAMAVDVSVFAVNVVTILGLGMAVDYSLFILSRYREELRTSDPESALVTAMSTTGKAVAFSGVTLATSLIGLFVFPILALRSMAVGGIAVAVLAIVIALTVLPALIAVLGTRVEALAVPFLRRPSEAERPGGGFWHNLAFQVMRHPGLIGGSVVLFLLLLGVPFLGLRTSRQDARAIDERFAVRQVDDLMNSEFLPNETTPHLVVLQADGDIVTPERVGPLYDYFEALVATPGVSRVDSVFGAVPGLSREQYIQLLSAPLSEQPPELQTALGLYADREIMRLAVVSEFEVDDPEAQNQVSALRAIPPPAGSESLVGGNAAEIFDTKEVIVSRLPWTLLIVSVATFTALFLVFGSVTLPVKAMIMNALSLTASFGAIVFIFQDGRLESLLGYESLGTIDVTLPILMFAFLFGLSMDYEVLMLSRVREEYVKTGDNSLAVARGLEKTGQLITSAAALLIVVLASFGTSELALMKGLGIGMALAIAIDATIVRALLVPASMRLMGAWNWWAPAPLVRVWERAGLGDLEGHGAGEATPAPIHPSVVVPAYRAAEAPAPSVATATAPPSSMSSPATVQLAASPAADGATVVLTSGALARAFLMEADEDRDGEHLLEFGVSEIGRLTTCTIVIPDSMVSGRHAAIERRADGSFVLEDLGSRNGTFVDGVRIAGETAIEDGSEVGFAERHFRLRIEQPEPEPEPPPPAPAQPERLVDPTVAIRVGPQGFDYLVQVAGPGAGASYPISGDTTTIGRDPRNDVALADPKTSAFHAHLQRGLDGGLVVEDRGSTNGTSINGQSLEGAHRLVDDDLIELGDSALQFKRFSAREMPQ